MWRGPALLDFAAEVQALRRMLDATGNAPGPRAAVCGVPAAHNDSALQPSPHPARPGERAHSPGGGPAARVRTEHPLPEHRSRGAGGGDTVSANVGATLVAPPQAADRDPLWVGESLLRIAGGHGCRSRHIRAAAAGGRVRISSPPPQSKAVLRPADQPQDGAAGVLRRDASRGTGEAMPRRADSKRSRSDGFGSGSRAGRLAPSPTGEPSRWGRREGPRRAHRARWQALYRVRRGGEMM